MRRGGLLPGPGGDPGSSTRLVSTRAPTERRGDGATSAALRDRLAGDAVDEGALVDELRHLLGVRGEREGAREIYACCVHGVFAANAIERLKASPIKGLVTTDFGDREIGHSVTIRQDGKIEVFDIRAGKVVWDTEGLASSDWQYAGPYSNFK